MFMTLFTLCKKGNACLLRSCLILIYLIFSKFKATGREFRQTYIWKADEVLAICTSTLPFAKGVDIPQRKLLQMIKVSNDIVPFIIFYFFFNSFLLIEILILYEMYLKSFRWHLGYCNWKYTPTYRGFDSFYGYYGGAEGYFSHKTSKDYLSTIFTDFNQHNFN
jgi:hypothetical protein